MRREERSFVRNPKRGGSTLPRHGEEPTNKQRFQQHQVGVCPKCTYESRTIGILEAERRYPDMVTGQVWKGNHAKYWFVCKTHGKYEQEFNCRGSQGCRCPRCADEQTTARQTKSHQQFVADLRRVNSNLVALGKYKRVDTKILYRCKLCKRVWSAKPNYLLSSGGGCACDESRGEKAVAEALKKLNISFEREKWFVSCRYKKPLPFDFYIPNIKTLIEFHGSPHYHPVKSWGGVKTLRGVRQRDGIKKRWARKNGFRLITICYRIKNIEAYLVERLRTLCKFRKAA